MRKGAMGWAAICCAAWAMGQETPLFRTGTREVALDLVVRDAKGRIVRNLKPEEVEILEDGVAQRVKSFRLVAGRAAAAPAVGRKQKASARPLPPIVKAGQPLPAVNLICIVFHNIEPTRLKFALDAMDEFLDHELKPGVGVAFFRLGSHLTPLEGFSSDRRYLKELAAQVFERPMPTFTRVAETVLNVAPFQFTVSYDMNGYSAVKLSGGEVNTAAITGAEVGTGQMEQIRRAITADHRRAFGRLEGMRQWDEMKLMLDELGPLPGRKTVLLVSGGLAVTGDPDEFQQLVDLGNRRQITLYALDINGLAENSNMVAGNAALNHAARVSRTQAQAITGAPGESGASVERSRQGDYIQMAVRMTDTQAGLRALAEGTGGFLIGNTENLGKLFARMFEEVNAHYEAVYRPEAERLDGHLRRIEVRVKRAGLNVQSRTGYYALPPSTRELTLGEVMALAALEAKPRPRAFPVRAAAYEFAGGRQRLAFEVDGWSLTAKAAGGGVQRVKATLFGLVRDEAGEVVERFTEELPVEVSNEAMLRVRRGVLPFSRELRLAPGRHKLEAVVVDGEGGRAAVVELPLEVKESVLMSTPVLVRQLETQAGAADGADPMQFGVKGGLTRRVVPALETRLEAQARPMVYVVVSPNTGAKERPRLEVEFLVEGRVVSKQEVELPEANGQGVIPMVVKTASHEGRNEVRLTAVQGTHRVERRLSYEVRP